MKRLIRYFLALAILVFAFGTVPTPADAAIRANTSDAVQSGANIDATSAIVQLKGDSLADYIKTHPTQGKKIDYSNTSVKSYQAQLSALRNQYKQWLKSNAPKAKVTGEFDTSLNAVAVQLNGETLAAVSASSMVQTAQYEAVFHPLADATIDPDLSLITNFAWQADGQTPPNAGEGVKVAIIDTGIDINHPCFSDAGYPNYAKKLGDTRFTNNKVIAAKVFNNRQSTKQYTPEAIQEHGTHVAGTVACNADTPASVSGVTIPYLVSGVAPRALLGNYSVFPADVADARSEDILNALESAYKDGFDVANMSLGGGSKGNQDLVIQAVNKLDEAGMVVAIASGNSGPGHYTVESPGAAERGLTAGASTVPHFVGTPVTVGGSTYGAAAGDFPTVSNDLTAPLGVVVGPVNGLNTACTALPANSLTGKIALISRGTCSFSIKIKNAQDAGAIAVLVGNNVAGDPTAMGKDDTVPAAQQPTVPAYMVSLASVPGLIVQDSQNATISKTLQYFSTTNKNIMAGFSSQGPTDVSYRIKPDVVAPGVNVLSSIPNSYCGGSPCWAFFQGTSMATPHLAGSAAVVLWQHPNWTAAQVRSAIVNTADRNALTDYRNGTTKVTDPNIIGAGLERLNLAVNAQVALDPVSISFGAIPSGAGQTKPFSVTLTNTSGSTQTFNLSIEGGDASVAYSVANGSLTLAPGQSGSVTVVMTATKGTASNSNHSGWLVIKSGGSEVAHAAIFTFVK